MDIPRCFDDGCKKAMLLLHLFMQTGDTTEIFYHVTHNTIDFGLQEKPAINVYRA